MAYYIAREAGLYILFKGWYRRIEPTKLFSKSYNYEAEVDDDYWYGTFGSQELKGKWHYFREAPVRLKKGEWDALYDSIMKIGKLRDLYTATAKALYSIHKKKGNKNGK
jgi:hypothetical protein